MAAKTAPGRWTKSSFRRGFSHYLYGAYFDANDPWASSVKFGQIASKDVIRDICRSWRLLVIDTFPECPQMLDLFTEYFEWFEMAYWCVQSDESLAYAAVLN